MLQNKCSASVRVQDSVFQPFSVHRTLKTLLIIWRNLADQNSANLRIYTEPRLKNTGVEDGVVSVFEMSVSTSISFRYGKYKPLTQPAKCVRCSEKRIKMAYHQYCGPCVRETGGCAKCGQTEVEVVNKPQPTPAESARMEAEFQKELKLLPERKRRTFMRYLQQQEKSKFCQTEFLIIYLIEFVKGSMYPIVPKKILVVF